MDPIQRIGEIRNKLDALRADLDALMVDIAGPGAPKFEASSMDVENQLKDIAGSIDIT